MPWQNLKNWSIARGSLENHYGYAVTHPLICLITLTCLEMFLALDLEARRQLEKCVFCCSKHVSKTRFSRRQKEVSTIFIYCCPTSFGQSVDVKRSILVSKMKTVKDFQKTFLRTAENTIILSLAEQGKYLENERPYILI